MSDVAFRILLMDRDATWLRRLKNAIEEEGHVVDVVTDLTNVRHYLIPQSGNAASPYDVGIISDDVEGQQGSLFAGIAQHHGAGNQPLWAISKLIAISGMPRQSDLGTALEHQTLLRNLHLQGIIFRGENVGQCLAIISGLLYRERRADIRISVKYKVRATLIDARGNDGAEIDGTMVDLCLSGAQIVLRRWTSVEELAPGTAVKLSWRSPYDQSVLECPGIIRRVRPQRSIFGHRLALGIQFGEFPANVRDLMRMLIDYENDMHMINRLAAMGLQPETIDFEKFQRLERL